MTRRNEENENQQHTSNAKIWIYKFDSEGRQVLDRTFKTRQEYSKWKKEKKKSR